MAVFRSHEQIARVALGYLKGFPKPPHVPAAQFEDAAVNPIRTGLRSRPAYDPQQIAYRLVIGGGE